MPSDLTPDSLRALLVAATRGPWIAVPAKDGRPTMIIQKETYDPPRADGPSGALMVRHTAFLADLISACDDNDANAAVIVALVNAAPRLADALELAEATVAWDERMDSQRFPKGHPDRAACEEDHRLRGERLTKALAKFRSSRVPK